MWLCRTKRDQYKEPKDHIPVASVITKRTLRLESSLSVCIIIILYTRHGYDHRFLIRLEYWFKANLHHFSLLRRVYHYVFSITFYLDVCKLDRKLINWFVAQEGRTRIS